MPTRGKDSDIAFIVQYKDGRTAFITIDRFTLRNGDHIARTIAREWQQGGRIPEGKIVSVKRGKG
jgi:hypothetical protein